MHQNLVVILWQLYYCKNSFIVLTRFRLYVVGSKPKRRQVWHLRRSLERTAPASRSARKICHRNHRPQLQARPGAVDTYR